MVIIGVLCTYVLIFGFAQIHILYAEALIILIIIAHNNINVSAYVNLHLYGYVRGLTAEAAAEVKRAHIGTNTSIQLVTFGQREAHLIARIYN